MLGQVLHVVARLRRPQTLQLEAKIKVPGARKLRTEIYTDAEADLMLAWAASQTKRRGGSATSCWPRSATRGCAATRLPCCASTRWTSRPVASRWWARATSPESCPSLPRCVPVLDDYLTSLRPALAKSAFFFVNPCVATRRPLRGTLRPDDGGQAGPARRHRSRGQRSPLPSPLAPLLRHQPPAPGSRHPRRPAPARPLQHRHDDAVPAPLRRRPVRRRGQGLPRRVSYSPSRISG